VVLRSLIGPPDWRTEPRTGADSLSCERPLVSPDGISTEEATAAGKGSAAAPKPAEANEIGERVIRTEAARINGYNLTTHSLLTEEGQGAAASRQALSTAGFSLSVAFVCSQVFHSSTSLPSTMRAMLMPSSVTGSPVSRIWTLAVMRVTTFSPSTN
jgi:hypothetical protein